MSRLSFAFVLVLAAACAGKATSSTTGAGSGSSAPVLAKKLAISWGITPQGELAEIYLATTDETGKQVSHPVGTYKGTCEPFKPAAEMNALTGVRCTTSGGGTELHAVVPSGDEVIVVQMGTEPGRPPDPMSREEVIRVKIPLGVGISVAD